MSFETVPIREEIDIEGFNSIYYFEFDKNFSHKPEQHDFWEFVYVDKGKVLAFVDDMYINLSQGQVIFHKPMRYHAHISNKNDPNNLLVVSFTCKSEIMDNFDNLICTLEKNSKKLLSLFIETAKCALKEIPNRYDDKKALNFDKAMLGSPQLLKCYLIEFLYSVLYNESGKIQLEDMQVAKQPVESDLAKSVDLYLRNNLDKNISLKEIADYLLISESYLSKIFKEATSNTIIDYFIRLKIEEAKLLIRKDMHNITQISEKLGYSSLHHFSRSFKKFTGFSPLEYKKSIRQKE